MIGHIGDRALMVRYGPATHEVASADWTELLLLAALAASAPAAKPKGKRKTTKAEASAAIAAGLQKLEDGTPEAALAEAVGGAA